MVFSFAAFIAGIAGVIWGHSFPIIKAAKFDFNMSIEILVIVVLGGMGSVRGSVIAAIILRVLPEMLKEFEQYRMLIYSLVLILMMIFNHSPMFEGMKLKLTAFFSKNKNEKKNTNEVNEKGGEVDGN
jgi:branched-chain amino acid transport system permease protein